MLGWRKGHPSSVPPAYGPSLGGTALQTTAGLACEAWAWAEPRGTVDTVTRVKRLQRPRWPEPPCGLRTEVGAGEPGPRSTCMGGGCGVTRTDRQTQSCWPSAMCVVRFLFGAPSLEPSPELGWPLAPGQADAWRQAYQQGARAGPLLENSSQTDRHTQAMPLEPSLETAPIWNRGPSGCRPGRHCSFLGCLGTRGEEPARGSPQA